MARPDSKWYKLDSAGILYSALQKEEYSAIYRFSARMEGEVDPAALQRAIDRCMPCASARAFSGTISSRTMRPDRF